MRNTLLLIIGFVLVSCHSDLEIQQESELSSASMWVDESDAVSAMFGTHELLRSAFNKGLVFWGEYRNGLWGAGTNKGLSQTVRDQVYQNNIPNTNTYADWTNLYKTINMSNLLLKYTPEIDFVNEDLKNEVLANGYFVRALSYYWIVRIWGDAPLVLDGYESDSQDLLPPRASKEEIFNQIKDDIDTGLQLMPSSVTSKSTASKGVLNMLLADFSLWMYAVEDKNSDYLELAENAVDNVLNEGYSLQNDYAKIFEDSGNNEIIYAWNYERDEYTGGYPEDYQFNSSTVSSVYHNNPVAVGTQQQWAFYTDDYVSILTEDENDKRLETNYLTFYDDLMGQEFNWTNKYRGSWIDGTRILDSDIILYRLADAFMFKAEIAYYNEQIDESIRVLNQLLQRAYGVEKYYDQTYSLSELKGILVNERLKEFPAEGKTWWDLIRFDVAFETNPFLEGRENAKNVLLWPLSDKSLNDNPNLGGQTPGLE